MATIAARSESNAIAGKLKVRDYSRWHCHRGAGSVVGAQHPIRPLDSLLSDGPSLVPVTSVVVIIRKDSANTPYMADLPNPERKPKGAAPSVNSDSVDVVDSFNSAHGTQQ